MDEQTRAYIIFVLGLAGMVMYCFAACFILLSLIGGRFYLYRQTDPTVLADELPGVSVIKPLMGVDPLLEENLESYFQIKYPQMELLFCVQDDQDPAIEVVRRLREKYPKVKAHLFIGGKNGIVNPLVHNMAPGYEASKYDYVWVSTSRIKANTDIMLDMVGKILMPNVALVHQMPFTTDQKGFAAAVEKVYFGSIVPRYFIALNMLGICCFVGMSYLFKKSAVEEVNGLSWYGRYLAEDFFLSRALHERGHKLVVSAFPAQQNVGVISVGGYKDRMVRWARLRLNMITVVTAILEPLTECLTLGLYGSWCFYHFFGMNPYILFSAHVGAWLVLDYIQLRNVQKKSLPFSKLSYIVVWIFREVLTIIVFIQAVINPRRIKWGRQTYKLGLGGYTELVKYEPLLNL